MSSILQIAKGTNISHWLSQSKARGVERKAWFTREDVHRIRDAGFDHIRLPFDEEQMWNEHGKPEHEAFDLMDSALDWCGESGLKVILDFHILRSHFFNDANTPKLFTDPQEQSRFRDLWLEVSARMRRRSSELVAYEILNEAVAPDPSLWNQAAIPVFKALRQAEPDRTIVLGSNRFNSVETFEALDVPDDKLLILTFHFYNPMFLTHFKASWWRGGVYDGRVQYPGRPIPDQDWNGQSEDFRKEFERENRPFGPDRIEELLEQPLAVSKRTGRPLYCGEFGCYNKSPLVPCLGWYEDILEAFREHEIAWANWDYKGGFGLWDRKGAPTPISQAFF
jgi:endoglucanase